MASVYQMPQQQFFGGGAPVQKYDEDDSGLEDSLLDHHGVDSGLDMSPAMADSRRASFAVGGSLFSPKVDAWPVDMQAPVAPSNPFLDGQSNNPFMRMDPTQAAMYGTPSAAWSIGGSPMQQFDGMPFDPHAPSLFARGIPNQAAFAAPQMPLFTALPVTSSPPMAASPHKDWVMVAHNQAMAKKASDNGAILRTHNDLRRGDGIRKKNARFDIPVERTLSNIDNLIAVCKNDADLKELKQQKRLLRNRQAALDSRQRKKQHTERLEDEKKQYTALVNDMEEEINSLRVQVELLMREKQSAFEYIETINHEKEEMIRAHTVETGDLRKKIAVLGHHVQRFGPPLGTSTSSAAATAAAATSDFANFDDMDSMAMPGSWDDCDFLDEFGTVEAGIKPEQPLQVLTVKKGEMSDVEKTSGPGGLLFMLLLVGAFVLSNRSMPPVHRVPEEMRVASASLLDTVLKDAGVGSYPSAVGGIPTAAPQPSGIVNGGWSGASAGNVMMQTPISLGAMGEVLTRPTQQQVNEQIFSISPGQYNGVSDHDFVDSLPERSSSDGRRNLANALAAVRMQVGDGSAADLYAKSLLWDQIPSQIVREFAKLVSGCDGDDMTGAQRCTSDVVAAP